MKISATLSTFSLSLDAEGMDYLHYEDMVKDTRLVSRDGSEKRVSLMGFTSGGGGIGNSEYSEEVWTTVHFIGITDPSDFIAIRMGDHELPLS